MRVLVTGSAGQLGKALIATCPPKREVIGFDLPERDVARLSAIDDICGEHPALVIHAAAMTDVDGCARCPGDALRVNALGTRNVALACQNLDAEMIAVSTNEVFDGRKGNAYLESDEPGPVNPYGASKLAGERWAASLLTRCYIVRTAWLYGEGERNFVRKVIARARKDGELAVVTDEVGSPTYALDLANALWQLAETHAYGTYHLTNEGACSRHEFARAALDLAGLRDVPVRAIRLADFQRASTVPPCTPLRNLRAADLGIRLRPWREALADYLSLHAPA